MKKRRRRRRGRRSRGGEEKEREGEKQEHNEEEREEEKETGEEKEGGRGGRGLEAQRRDGGARGQNKLRSTVRREKCPYSHLGDEALFPLRVQQLR